MYYSRTKKLCRLPALPNSTYHTFLKILEKHTFSPNQHLALFSPLVNYVTMSAPHISINPNYTSYIIEESSCKAHAITHTFGSQIRPEEATHSLNSVIDAPTITERIKFYNASLFSLTLSTLAQAIAAGFLTTFPVFTTKKYVNIPQHRSPLPWAIYMPNTYYRTRINVRVIIYLLTYYIL